MNQFKRANLHPLAILILGLIYLALILINNKLWFYWLATGLAIINLSLFKPINWRWLVIISLGLIPFNLALYLSSLFFLSRHQDMLALSLISRNYALVISAVIFINTVDFEELIMYFMQAWRLPVTLGYPLLSTVNAFHNIRQELTRIQNAQLMRYGCKKFSLRICYPMLVSISRYAFYNGLSMTCRGLNRQ
ncbi:MAG: hypothetical protein ACK4M7_06110, partial [Burkholderiales bacterium]